MSKFEELRVRGRKVYLIDLLWRTIERYERSDCAVYATGAAFSLLLSLFPLLIVFVAIFGLLLAFPGLGPWVDQVAADRVPGDAMRQLVESISGVPVGTNSVIGFVGLVTLMWAASGMFATLRRGLNRALGIDEPTDLIRARVLDLARLLGLFLVGLIFIVLAAALGALKEVSARVLPGRSILPMWGVFEWLTSYAMLTLVILLIYTLVPNQKIEARQLWPAAIVAGMGLRLTAMGFGYYVDNFAEFQLVYGALAGAVALLIFLKVNSSILLFAAVLAMEAAQERPVPTEERVHVAQQSVSEREEAYEDES